MLRNHASNSRCNAFANCGNSLWLKRDGEELVLTSNHCNDRLCVPCQRLRQQALVDAICIRMQQVQQRVRFVTFTLRCQPVPLRDQIDRLTASLRRLRQRKFWRGLAVGGAIFLEIKIGENSGQWHVHAHCLVEGSFIDVYALSREWHAVTGDSSIIDVRAITDGQKRAQYVTKYATKPASADVIRTPHLLDEFMLAVKGKRLYQTFGSWSELLPEDDDTPRKLTPIDSIVNLISRAHNPADVDAQIYLRAACARWPTLTPLLPPTLLESLNVPAPP